MHVYLPIAEMSISVEAILTLGLCVGFLSGFFGVGGGFLTTPFLMFLGVPPAIAVGTQTSQLVASSVTGVLGHWKNKNVDLKIAGVMLGGGIFGSFIGVFIFKMLQALGQIDVAIRLLYVVLLGTIGTLMLIETTSSFWSKKKKDAQDGQGAEDKPSLVERMKAKMRTWPYKMRFPVSKLHVSVFVPVGIGFIGGVLASILGIGGGFLLVPAMIYFLGMPATLVAGTCLFQIIFTTGFASIMHATANHTVDVVLAALLITGGVIGAQVGVRASKYVSGAKARIFLAVLILGVSLVLAGQLLIAPKELYSLEVRL
ncbi:MAG: sulfite exporter TauE/SafE family protein [Pseudomonadota bacterium]|jgi:hypothetical protein|nr:permease [Alphaproteobacteria bacterium]MCS5596204.1 sulfite exporter TauE/SafE family protein [Alphaproteobacteria bacterium]MEC7703048.1 sulfite exporter TauE/SafE family protein [Pseudomonadota bacterium]MED5422210.1 sulfite exporter TauE/SafE family protein [Pseudomonadota bacterium]MEE3323177.1 sulfite exporter TauE/SafE family protein [Pseudomonadota bacterium]|tara:strand:+ start:246 stop:1187 length:942 start_codon:yes stop_codon:yes gene_type:complete